MTAVPDEWSSPRSGKQNPAYDRLPAAIHAGFAAERSAGRWGALCGHSVATMSEIPASLLAAELARDLPQRAERCRELALDVHRDPELGCREFHTVTRLAGELEEEGFEVETALGGLPTAFRAVRGQGGRCVAFLAEYDALPGLGHGCGHNLIVAASCTAAAALGTLAGRLGGRVALIGAPAEETLGGKVVLAVKGVFDDIDAALLAHPGSQDAVVVESLASW